MAQELKLTLEKQASRIALLEEELKAVNRALEEKSRFVAALEVDLEHALDQLENSSHPKHNYLPLR